MTVELERYIKTYKKDVQQYTKQALSKAKSKIKWESFKLLNDFLVEEYYKYRHKTYNGYRLLGIDKTSIDIPDGKENKQVFGSCNNNGLYKNQASSILIYDVLNEIALDILLVKNGGDEREEGIILLKQQREKPKKFNDILVLDRGYPSMKFIIELNNLDYEYVIRCPKKGFIKEVQNFIDDDNLKDEVLEIPLKGRKMGKKQEKIETIIDTDIIDKLKIRVVKIKLKTGCTEYLITSLTDKKKFKSDDLGFIYQNRWKEETFFGHIKTTMQLENFSSKKPDFIKQEFYSKIVVSNLHSMIIEDSQAEIDKTIQNNNRYKYRQYKPNKNVTYGIMHQNFFKLFNYQDESWLQTYNYLVSQGEKHKVSVRKDRNYPRDKISSKKYPMNKRKAA